MNPHIFREYDIRGIVDKDLPAGEVLSLGKAAGTYLLRRGAKTISLGRDVRLSSDSLHDLLLRGLLQTGLHVIDIGICPTPVLYFSIHHLKTDGGIMITGSHNPPEFNGFKICAGPDPICGDEIQDLRRVQEKGMFRTGTGRREEASLLTAYQDLIRSRIRIPAPPKVVLDAANGTAGLVAPDLIRSLGCETVCLYCEPDGRFPNHHPDPIVPENLEDLRRRVVSEQAACGLSFDGDADRLGVVDETGEILWGDRLLILFSRFLLREHPGACILSEVKSTRLFYEDVPKHGGRAVMWKAGHSLLKRKMKEEKALLAGEICGHMFFADRYFGYDDAVYAACRLLEILGGSDRPLSRLLSDLPETFSTPEIRVDCPDDRKFHVVDQVRRAMRDRYEVVELDGVRVEFPDGWGLVRASNTQPALVLRFEAESEKRLAEIRTLVEEQVNESRGNLSRLGTE